MLCIEFSAFACKYKTKEACLISYRQFIIQTIYVISTKIYNFINADITTG